MVEHHPVERVVGVAASTGLQIGPPAAYAVQLDDLSRQAGFRTSSSECRGIDVSRRKATGVKDAQLPHLIDIRALAEHLGVPVRHVRQLVADRRIPFHKWGHLIRFDAGEVASG